MPGRVRWVGGGGTDEHAGPWSPDGRRLLTFELSREYDLTALSRGSETLAYGIEQLTQRTEIAAYGAGFRPHMQYPLVESYLPGEPVPPDES